MWEPDYFVNGFPPHHLPGWYAARRQGDGLEHYGPWPADVHAAEWCRQRNATADEADEADTPSIVMDGPRRA